MEEKIHNIIEDIIVEEIEDSRGNPTISVHIYSSGKSGTFEVPSGASTGAHEAFELRDEDKKGVKNSIIKITESIAPAIDGRNIFDQKGIDHLMIELDGTKNKKNLGGNSMIGVSIACAKAAANVKNIQLYEYLRELENIKPSQKIPYLYMNLINGGKHAKNGLAFQEYHVVPVVKNAGEAVEIGNKIVEVLGQIIRTKYGDESLVLGDEGGFAPKITNIREPLVLLSDAIEAAGLKGRVRLALDVAASSFFENGKYKIGDDLITKEALMEIYKNLMTEFNLLSIEDPFDEEDFESFKILKELYPDLKVVGDDLTVTNVERLKEAIEKKSINAMIVKPNQVGTLTETLATMKLARENNIDLIVSHRSGETEDTFIADLAYAFGTFGLKSGAPGKKERKVKYDRLIEISKK